MDPRIIPQPTTLAGDTRLIPSAWTYIPLGMLFVWMAILGARRFAPRPLANAPLVYSEFDAKTRAQRFSTDSAAAVRAVYQILQEGHAMVRLTVSDGTEVAIMNHRYLKELRSLPDTKISIEIGVNESFVSEYSHIKVVNSVGQNAIRADLTPGLPRLMPVIASEAHFALRDFFPYGVKDWTRIKPFECVLKSVTQVSARLFVGEDLCRDAAWSKAASNATLSAFDTAYAIKKWPAWLRPIFCHSVPEYKSLMQARADATRILKTAAAARVRDDGKKHEKEDYIINWIFKKRPEWTENFGAQVDLQIELSVAAIHTTTMAMTHMLYDLAAHPQYLPILRAEIKSALEATNGQYNKDCIAKMGKIDSFMMESQRLHPPSLTTFQRFVLEDCVLADGTRIPKGVTIAIDSWARYRDPNIWENPDQFDGLRFVKLREESQDKGNHQFVASNPDHLVWGQGRHACPGQRNASPDIVRC